VHVNLGLTLIPVLLAKLWSVMPKLFVWPPARSLADVLERLSLLLLVGGALFEFVTGVLNIQYDYVFGFDFYTAHYYGAWVFTAALAVHVAVKFPAMVRGLRSRSLRSVLRTSRAATKPDPPDGSGLVAEEPRPATISRRGALGLVGGGAALIAALSVGQTLGGPARRLALLLPRSQDTSGPNGFPVNRTAAAAGVTQDDVGSSWRLTLLGGPEPVTLDLPALSAMSRRTATLPIACVEGWSTTQRWTGVPLRLLAERAGVPRPHSAVVRCSTAARSAPPS
jgi:DMSO/TMAO reductase YedYZ molybdopterin-dependent catalytic subunit